MDLRRVWVWGLNFNPKHKLFIEFLRDIPEHPMHAVQNTCGENVHSYILHAYRLSEQEIETLPNKISITWEDGRFWSRTAGIMVNGTKRVLLSRLDDEDIWALPGGLISLYETSQETVKREFLEETGFEIEIHRLLWIIENFFVLNNKKCHEIGFYFLVSPKETKGIWEQDEFVGQEEQHTPDRSWKLIFKWFDPSELDKLNLKPSVLIELLKNLPEHPVHIIHQA